MLTRLCMQKGIHVVNIVRNEGHVQQLNKEYPAPNQVALNSESPTFWEDLKKLIDEKKIEYIIDCLGGEQPAKILEMLPPKGTLCSVGNMVSTTSPINLQDLHVHGKVVEGVMMARWFMPLPTERKE